MAISCLGFNTIALFSRQIFKIDDAPVNASLIFWFCFAEMICSVPRNSPMGDYQKIWLTGEHSEPIGTIRTLAYVPTQKSPPSVQAVFQVAPAPISSRFLCPRRLYYLARPTKTAMLCRLSCMQIKSLFASNVNAHSASNYRTLSPLRPDTTTGYPSETNFHPFEENCHSPFEQLELSIQNDCQSLSFATETGL